MNLGIFVLTVIKLIYYAITELHGLALDPCTLYTCIEILIE